MQIRELLRTTTFRLSALYGLLFALGMVALLGLVYTRSAGYLTRRVDGILSAEMASLAAPPRANLAQRIADAVSLNGDRTNVFALFDPSGARVAGNLAVLPVTLKNGGRPVEIAPTAMFPAPARLIARALPGGEVLVVGRDVNQLQEMRSIIASSLGWSGVLIIIVGFACGTALSLRPLQRLRMLQDACQEIASGDLTRRLPTSSRHDELDMFAGTVNYMIDEVERLMFEVKGATETIAHDLRTPLTRARAQLHRIQTAPGGDAAAIARVTAELDTVLERFRALLRISELEARERHGGVSPVDLATIVEEAAELYQPLAEAGGVRLTWAAAPGAWVEADPKLLFEAVSNLVDNAIKFSREGGSVRLHLGDDPARPRIVVEDDGPGIPAGEKAAVLQRFYRGERDRMIPGSGLGLSIAAAILRLHRFSLELEDANPGLRAVIACAPPHINY